MKDRRLALYTTVHPGSLRYLAAWLRSVERQTDDRFDLWIGLHGVGADALGSDPGAVLVEGRPGATPTDVRRQALEEIASRYWAVVLVDSDDLLEPERIARARAALAEADVVGCAMRIVDEQGADTGLVLAPPSRNGSWDLLVRANCFGLGNSAYRSSVLQRCLPIPSDCVMEDWFLATRAWTQGARLAFDGECGMAYRRHGANMTSVVAPFTERELLRETDSVLEHYRFVLASVPELRASHRRALEHARAEAAMFRTAITSSAATMRRYLDALNGLPPAHIWFDCVAHPELEAVWKRSG